jgi:hypothetical protein
MMPSAILDTWRRTSGARGADPTRCTDRGATADTIARAHGHAAVARRLRGDAP